jgi:hypothetical protein
MKRIVFTVIAIAGIMLLAGCQNGTIPATYAVTVSPSGAATGESLSADMSEAEEGATVTLTAALNSDRQVALSASGVTISPSTISSDGGTATFTMPAAAVDVTATFSDIPATTYGVTVSPSGAATGESVSADVSEAEEGATVTLTAALNSGRRVALSASGVTISPSTISSNGGTATFTMPAAAVDVTAVFSNTDTGKSYGDFGVTLETYEDISDWDQIVSDVFGSSYRVADWDDLVAYHNAGGDLLDLFDGLGLTEVGNSAFVERSGDPNYSTDRYYYASRHEHNKPGHYLAHDNIDNYLISLGSWYGSRNIMVVKVSY